MAQNRETQSGYDIDLKGPQDLLSMVRNWFGGIMPAITGSVIAESHVPAPATAVASRAPDPRVAATAAHASMLRTFFDQEMDKDDTTREAPNLEGPLKKYRDMSREELEKALQRGGDVGKALKSIAEQYTANHSGSVGLSDLISAEYKQADMLKRREVAMAERERADAGLQATFGKNPTTDHRKEDASRSVTGTTTHLASDGSKISAEEAQTNANLQTLKEAGSAKAAEISNNQNKATTLFVKNKKAGETLDISRTMLEAQGKKVDTLEHGENNLAHVSPGGGVVIKGGTSARLVAGDDGQLSLVVQKSGKGPTGKLEQETRIPVTADEKGRVHVTVASGCDMKVAVGSSAGNHKMVVAAEEGAAVRVLKGTNPVGIVQSKDAETEKAFRDGDARDKADYAMHKIRKDIGTRMEANAVAEHRNHGHGLGGFGGHHNHGPKGSGGRGMLG